MTEGSGIPPLNHGETTTVEISEAAVMNKRPLVSVHMITYNHDPYIGQAIEGVLLQETGFPIELVIGEDCSTDGTRETVLEYQKKHPEAIRVITSDHNVGVRRNAFRTVKACRGKYVAFCEGDDHWIHPRKLQMQVETMESDPKVGLVYGGYHVLFTETGRLAVWLPPKERASRFDDMFTKMITGSVHHPVTCTVCIRSEIFSAVLNDNAETFNLGFPSIDTQIWLEASRLTGLKCINEPLSVYSVLPESASHSKDIGKVIQVRKSGYEMYLHYVRKYNCPVEVERIVHERSNRRLLELAYKASDLSLADSCAEKLVEIGARLTVRQRLILLGLRRNGIRPIITAMVGFSPRRIVGRVLTSILPPVLYARLRRTIL